MSDTKDGGPAFPTQGYDQSAAMNGIGVTVTDQPGMTLRDWFAGQALVFISGAPWRDIQGHEPYIAQMSYAMADAMLSARSKGDGENG